ncbi:MAG TPA: triple tyrosine motif-containing protein [Steroidobacteraceae bacterium]|nr:triple tyrosine motif-containing protein [Steroidobacteraceae bacterium]
MESATGASVFTLGTWFARSNASVIADCRRAIRLDHRQSSLGFRFVALNYRWSSKNRYAYKLEGFDAEWVPTDSSRREAIYTNLPPGHYVFRVKGSNNDGVWNEQGASLDIRIAPAYWQTIWFRAICVLTVAAFLWGLYLLRLRQVAREFERTLDTRVAERTRIARELHDTLLQSFSGLLLRFRTVERLFSAHPDEAREVLDAAIHEARKALTEGRQAVQGLRSSVVETHELSQAIRTLAQELASEPAHAGGAEVRLNIEGTPRDLRPLIRDDIYRLVGEALRNAFRHAEASHIEVQLVYDARRFELRVRDDGKGIEPAYLREGGPPGAFRAAGHARACAEDWRQIHGLECARLGNGDRGQHPWREGLRAASQTLLAREEDSQRQG